MLKKLTLLFAICIILCFSACKTTKSNHNVDNQLSDTISDVDGNPHTTHETIDGETSIFYDYSSVYATLDLSQYENWGSFGEDGLMWVEKSDYTGKQFGYIDYNGNVIIPFTSKIKEPGNFVAGYAIVACESDVMNNGIYNVINTKGETVFEFKNYAISSHYQSSNGNIVFMGINLNENTFSSTTKNYIFCSNIGNIVEFVGDSSEPMLYSNGLLRTHRTNWDTPNKKIPGINYIDIVTFYDENGNEALTVDTNSSEYYRELLYVEDFINEVSTVYFQGLDRNYYTVQINKKGEWISEPVDIEMNEVKRF